MDLRMIDEMSLETIRLIDRNRTRVIWFGSSNRSGQNISYDDAGVAWYHDPNHDNPYLIHADLMPAIIFRDGSHAWVKNGQLHRWGGPAIEDRSGAGIQYWLNNIYLSEEEYTECICDEIEPIAESVGLVYYKRDSKIVHRKNGPAVFLHDGTRMWYQNDVLHREDGPAVEGNNFESYWIEGSGPYDGPDRYCEPQPTANLLSVALTALAISGLVGMMSHKKVEPRKLEIFKPEHEVIER